MNKKILIAIIVVIGLALVVHVGLNSARESAESQLREQNPLFHTVPEGGSCVDGRGDCLGGLTCTNAICQKPE